jgi:Fe-S-cluster containining protein
MRDGLGRRVIKKTLRAIYLAEVGVRRAYVRARGRSDYDLAGDCKSCARCCEAPTFTLPLLVFWVAPLRWLFIRWQWLINRFELVRSDAESSSLIFRCAHFDAATRRCDSYDSRPGVCWDYPRHQLDQPWPELFDECGYRAVSRRADKLASALDAADLSPEQRERLKRRLHVLK